MTMLESNRATVLQFCDRLSRRDFAGMMELVTPDATWWVIGRPDYASYGGMRPITEVMQTLDSFVGALDDFCFTVENSTAEGDRVVIEATSSGRMATANYNNVYLMRYQLQDGKIQSIREFFDGYEITDYLKQIGITNEQAFAGLSGS